MSSSKSTSMSSLYHQFLYKRRHFSPAHSFLYGVSYILFGILSSLAPAANAQVANPVTNPLDLEVLYEVMYAMNHEYDWKTYFPDPCISGPQGIGCQSDAVTGVYYVTQLQFGFISPIANIIPCSDNATIPTSISKLTRLDTVLFYNCFLNGSSPIPNEISELGPSLRLLSFSGNPGLSGGIPSGFGTLAGLQRLILSQNSLTGSIPEELGNLTNLMQLDLSHNNLTGSIPGRLGSLNNLVNLDFRYNQLGGDFPVSLSQGLPQLQRMAMSFNNLQGSLPNTFTGLQSITYLDLSFNNLTGTLPQSLGGLSNLEDLFLNANSIGGVLPQSLGSLSKLVRLDLSSSSLTGAIPTSFKNLFNLRYLSMSNNRLTGPIPPSLGSLPHIFTLNLDGNQLTGPVPFSASFVQRMGRNLVVKGNPGLCYTPVKPSTKMALGVVQCPNSSTLDAAAPSSTTSSPNAASSLKDSSRHYCSWVLSFVALIFLYPHNIRNM